MTPKMPKAEPKISTIRILTKRDEFWASASAQELPAMPTHTLTERHADTLRTCQPVEHTTACTNARKRTHCIGW